MARSPRSMVALVALALASPALATPRLAIAPVKGDARGAVGAQLGGALCDADRCLPGALGGERPDLSRARRLGADASLLGSIWTERGGRVLSLALFTAGSRPARSWVLPLGADGLLSPARLDRLAAEVDAALGVAPPPGQALAAAPPLAALPPASPRPAPAPPAPPPTSPPPPRLELSVPTRPPPRPPPPGPWLAVEAGVEPVHLALQFPAGGTAPVGYAVDLPAAPRLGLELYPLRRADGRAAGLALFGAATWQPGIALPAGATTHQASWLRLRAGLSWRLAVARWLTVVPALAFERETFTVVAAGGARVPGLPDTRLTGGSAALGLELPLGGPRLALLAGGRATWWLDPGELAGGGSFYPGGSASTLEAEAGATVALGGPFSLRALGRWAATRWSLDADPSGAWTVRSALAESWGGRVVLRVEL